ncbi:MAG: hypothetical protein II350_02230 [Clostridia bacterium]|nr:hypothetical protein [Clostridia bacterium]
MKKILCIGEILWDVIGENKYLGGAPLNVAANLSALGAESWVLSALGKDELGRLALEKMASANINTGLVAVLDGVPTGTAIVHPELDGNERFELPYPVAYDGIELSEDSVKLLCEIAPDGIVYGTLGAYRSPKVLKSLQAVLASFPYALTLYDVNLRKDYFNKELVSFLASRATVMKLNDGEVEILSPMLFGKKLGIADFAKIALASFGCKYVVVTKGEHGAEIFGRDAKFSVCGINADVVDTVGAGDAFSAGVIMALLNGGTAEEALNKGNLCGAECVSHAGAFPVK